MKTHTDHINTHTGGKLNYPCDKCDKRPEKTFIHSQYKKSYAVSPMQQKFHRPQPPQGAYDDPYERSTNMHNM